MYSPYFDSYDNTVFKIFAGWRFNSAESIRSLDDSNEDFVSGAELGITRSSTSPSCTTLTHCGCAGAWRF